MIIRIKKKLILEYIFGYLRNKKKLKIIQYNKKLLKTLNITLKDFEVYTFLKELNKKFNLNIEDIDINKLDLNMYEIKSNSKIFDYIKKIKFTKLKELDLSHNKLLSINILEELKFEQLEKLDLGYNKISSINILEKS